MTELDWLAKVASEPGPELPAGILKVDKVWSLRHELIAVARLADELQAKDIMGQGRHPQMIMDEQFASLTALKAAIRGAMK